MCGFCVRARRNSPSPNVLSLKRLRQLFFQEINWSIVVLRGLGETRPPPIQGWRGTRPIQGTRTLQNSPQLQLNLTCAFLSLIRVLFLLKWPSINICVVVFRTERKKLVEVKKGVGNLFNDFVPFDVIHLFSPIWGFLFVPHWPSTEFCVGPSQSEHWKLEEIKTGVEKMFNDLVNDSNDYKICDKIHFVSPS